MGHRSVATAPIRWNRVGALSAAFNLHIVAAGLLLVAATAPPTTAPLPAPPPSLSVTIVEPPPIEAPLVPIAPADTLPSRPVPHPTRPAATSTSERAPLPSPAIEAVRPSPVQAAPIAGPAVPGSVVADRGVAVERALPPPYPAIARSRGWQGETVLRVLVGADGAVLSAEVSRSSGHRPLDQAALGAVRTWRFAPAIEQGLAVSAWVQVPVVFRLD